VYGADFFAEAERALRGLGFTAADATAAVGRARAHVGTEVQLADVIRACLRECPRPVAS
jgi:Holliday junction resolvasome RuvABC DNA-binding subunit